MMRRAFITPSAATQPRGFDAAHSAALPSVHIIIRTKTPM